ncbi:MAG TPA: dethiobiotin synthase [Polyangia bacterium]|nr:dethiobiotin synthase [Polyangia bacterium]
MTALRGIFVTGTDTGVGKTTVAAGLARYARRIGRQPVPFKPAETGCTPEAQDARLLWEAARPEAARPDLDLRDVCLYRFALPAAPAQAARAAGARLSLDAVLAAAADLAARGDFLIVEGAGGLLVPYGDDWTAADLIERLGLRVLVVARTALGTINHSALTVRELRRRGISIAGLILNQTTPQAAPHETGSFPFIAAATGLDPLGPVPWVAPPADPDRLADALRDALGDPALAALIGP